MRKATLRRRRRTAAGFIPITGHIDPLMVDLWDVTALTRFQAKAAIRQGNLQRSCERNSIAVVA